MVERLTLSKMDLKKIEKFSYEFRLKILKSIFKAQKGHIGGVFSIIDFISLLYLNNYVRLKKNKKIDLVNDDYCILSKGHAGIAQYVLLNHFKFIKDKDFDSFCKDGGMLGEHPDSNIPGIKVVGGSLGHGIGIASGIAYHRSINNINKKLYVIIGDGELSEGSNWEAILNIISSNVIKNLIIILDFNQYMTLKNTNEYIRKNKLKMFFDNSNFNFFDLNGHNFKQMNDCLAKIQKSNNNAFIVLNTFKAKGISFMENKKEWHHKVPDYQQFMDAKKEIEKKINNYA